VVVTVDQWGDVVRQLGGQCVTLTTIITGTSGDPHDYEPTPADAASFQGAALVVRNGLDYDHWAEQAVEALPTEPAVVDGGAVTGLEEGANPHLWYSPTDVEQMSEAITTELSKLAPAASSYFATQAQAWQAQLEPYAEAIEEAKAAANGKSYGATEPIVEYLAEAIALRNATPAGFQQAAANESEPSPGDVNDFEQALRDRTMNVLVYNTQTEGAVPEQLRGVAEDAGVPVVEVTETLPPGQSSFVRWQVAQLEALVQALGG
jgi:zinc/manganese transport system substrate-binding protein